VDAARAHELLAGTELFGHLDEDSLARLAAVTVTRTIPKGQALFRAGDPGEALFVVVEGLLKVTVSSRDGSELVLATLRPPEVFGELSLVDEGPRSASAVAVEPTTLLSLGRADLLDVLTRHPKPLGDLLRSLGALIRRLTGQASDLVFLDLDGRIAKLLVRMAEQGADGLDGPVVLNLALTQSDLAEMVGGSRQSLNQTLHAFERRGWITLGKHEICVDDLEALRRRAGM
jgi:CRP-like cAMP-binding protein